MDLQLEGRRALVTGGSRGIGKAVARVLLAEGAHVALLARHEPALREAVAELGAQGGRVVGVRADTTSDEQVLQAVREAERELGGGIDILVNAAAEPAGYAAPPRLEHIRAELLQGQIDTKVMGYLRCAREVVPGMRERGWGRIVNISGLAARQTGNTVGSIRNIAVAALTKNLADELGPFGIQVTAVHPGVTRTERTAARRGRAGDRAGNGRRKFHRAPAGRGRGGRRRGVPVFAALARHQRRLHCHRRRRAGQHSLLNRPPGAWASGTPRVSPARGSRFPAAVRPAACRSAGGSAAGRGGAAVRPGAGVRAAPRPA